MAKALKFIYISFIFCLGLGLLSALGAAAFIYWQVLPKLPDAETLREVNLQVPLRIYSRDGKLIGEFGDKRRTPVKYNDIPQDLINAVLATEDHRFYHHSGVSLVGLSRAVVNLVRTGRRSQGGSTITMQVARNFFLTRERTYSRKINEIFLAWKIERELSKNEILELYFNKIFFGYRAYGAAAAAEVYYGSDLHQLTLAQIATIAGLPKAPSKINPIANPEASVKRRRHVLDRMLALNFIDARQYQEASSSQVTARYHGLKAEIDAPYIAEMIRSEMLERYGEDAYNSGLVVTATIDSQLQTTANHALQRGLLDYEKRHGYRGPAQRFGSDTPQWQLWLDQQRAIGNLKPAIVIALDTSQARAQRRDGSIVTLDWPGLAWARPYISVNERGPAPNQASDILAIGDAIYIHQDPEQNWQLAQRPQVSGALVALHPDNAAISALVGGFDYTRSKFNRALQAQRQPGSSFKPFIYSAALEAGFTPASIINDAPVVFEDRALENAWRPENSGGRFYGPTRLRQALTKSRNLVSIRVLKQLGVKRAIQHATRFGFQADSLPANLSLALGSASVTPLDVASGYTILANGGFKVTPHVIDSVHNSQGELIYAAAPATACDYCDDPEQLLAYELEGIVPPTQPAERAIPAANAYLMTSMLQDVIDAGTGRRAKALGRQDLAGKTGTTNDQVDAWFSGYNPNMVTTVWVGFDQPSSLGRNEYGGKAALPIWMDFMQVALAEQPDNKWPEPPGLVTVRIDPNSGLLAQPEQADAIFEVFRAEDVPQSFAETATDKLPISPLEPDNIQLF